MSTAPALAPRHHEEMLGDALRDLSRLTRFPIVFGGFVHDGVIVVSRLIGEKHGTLRGLAVRSGHGLGGRALTEKRPRMTPDYASSTIITHDYDRAVLAESITTLLAVPVVVGDTVSGVLYGGIRDHSPLGGVSMEPAMSVARALGQRLHDDRRPEALEIASEPAGLSAEQVQDLRAIHAEIRGIGAEIADESLARRLAALESRIADVAWAHGRHTEDRAPDITLTRREIDVLSVAALGLPNAEIGRRLGLTSATVKSYMNTAMRKLGASTRYEAVLLARRARHLP